MLLPEYQGRIRLRVRPFPLELMGGEAAPRDILEQEWWLAALQEPAAAFAPYRGQSWPATTLPAFEAAWCAMQQGETTGHDYDLRVRRAFFSESRNIGQREVLIEVAQEAGLDLAKFTALWDSGVARSSVLEESRLGQERYRVRGTPTLMRSDGTRLRPPIAFPRMQARKIVSVAALSCCGDGCLEATRSLLEQVMQP